MFELMTHPFIALAAAGLVAGLMAGLFGIGGGVVLVPVFVSLFTLQGVGVELAMPMALATSLACIIPTACSSAYAQYRRQSVDMQVVRWLALPIALGASLGALVAGSAPAQGLLLFFAGFLLLIAALLLRGQKGFALVSRLPGVAGRHVLGAVIGGLSSVLGVGGGTMSVPTLIACGYPLKIAAGTGAALGLAIAGPGALAYVISGWQVAGLPAYSLGYIALPAVVIVAPLSALAAPFGVALAHRLPERWLRWLFIALLVAMAGRMVLKAL